MYLLDSCAQDWNLTLGSVLKGRNGGPVFLYGFFQIHIDVFSVFVDGTVATYCFITCFTEVLEYLIWRNKNVERTCKLLIKNSSKKCVPLEDAPSKMTDNEWCLWLRWPEFLQTSKSCGPWSGEFSCEQTHSLYRDSQHSPNNAQWPGNYPHSWCILLGSELLKLLACCWWKSWAGTPRYLWRELAQLDDILCKLGFGLEVYKQKKYIFINFSKKMFTCLSDILS